MIPYAFNNIGALISTNPSACFWDAGLFSADCEARVLQL